MSRQLKHVLVLSGSCLALVALALNTLQINHHLAVMLMMVASVFCGSPIVIRTFMMLRMRIINIDLLVSIAVIGAIYIGDYWEAAAVSLLFIFGAYLEARTLSKTRSSIQRLLDLAPKQATVLRNGIEFSVKPNEVIPGDTVLVRPGERIAIDGTVLAGDAVVNQAPITGESLPVHKVTNDSVVSGTVVETGYLHIKAERVGNDTVFSHIIQTVEDAGDSKAPTQRFMERFAKYYTPAIIVTSIITFLLTRDLVRSLTLLVISCPGALVISIPVSVVAGIGNGARRGVLFKGGDALERACKVNTVVFDKTGTLTVGHPQVTDIQAVRGEARDLLELAAAAEFQSEHPIARAIVAASPTPNGTTHILPEAFTPVKGQGILAVIEGRKLAIGNERMMHSFGVELTDKEHSIVVESQRQGKTVALMADEQGLLAIFCIADAPRTNSRTVVQQLKERGIRDIVMLTGDNAITARAIALQLGIEKVFADLLPEDKVEVIRQLQKSGSTVAMVGDGINDAPALATANIGIAIGGIGKDVAMEAADIILMSENLDQVPQIFSLSHATLLNLRENVSIAVLVVSALIAGVFMKSVFLATGMMVHELSVLVVVLNALRLVQYNRHDSSHTRWKSLMSKLGANVAS